MTALDPAWLLQHAREFWFPAVPEGHYLQAFSDIDMYGVTVAYRADRSWAILRRGGHTCWNFRSGEWEHEASPSNRTDEMRRDCRRELDEAVATVPAILALELARLEQRWPPDEVARQFSS